MAEKIPIPWLKLLPAWVRARIEHRPHLIKALSNTGWLFGDQVIRLGTGLVVSIWMARYLGPAEFGLFNYALAFVALFGGIASLGLGGIVVRDLVKEPQSADDLLGTTFLLQAIGGLFAFLIVVAVIGLARPDDSLGRLIIAVLGLAMVFKSAEVVKYWFQSQVQSKYTVWIESCVFLFIAAIKVALILGQFSLMAFVWAAFAESVLAAIGLLAVYAWRGGRLNAWRFRWELAKRLLKDSWPLILSALAVMVYMRIDQIMLGQMLDDEAVGIYSAAVRISEAWYFIPIAILASVYPAVVDAKKNSESLYYERLQKLFGIMTLIALVAALFTTFLSDELVLLLYGSDYLGAGQVLALHVWAGVFVFMGTASSQWYMVENLQKLLFYRTFIGALINVLANILLIPKLGITGAAVGTLLSQMAAAYLFDLFNRETRIMFRMKTKSLVTFYRYKA